MSLPIPYKIESAKPAQSLPTPGQTFTPGLPPPNVVFVVCKLCDQSSYSLVSVTNDQFLAEMTSKNKDYFVIPMVLNKNYDGQKIPGVYYPNTKVRGGYI
jgi:hypothetical protein